MGNPEETAYGERTTRRKTVSRSTTTDPEWYQCSEGSLDDKRVILMIKENPTLSKLANDFLNHFAFLSFMTVRKICI